MSATINNNSVTQTAEEALDFLLPDTQPLPPDRLDSFASSQSLTGHIALEGSSPFDGVYNIDGLFFIQLDGRVLEVEFDASDFRYNIVSPAALYQGSNASRLDAPDPEPFLRDWHPHYRADSKEWVLLHASSYPDADTSTKANLNRLTPLPYRVDGLLRLADLNIIIDTVETFLLQRRTVHPQTYVPAQTLLSLLAYPHQTVLSARGNIEPTRKILNDTLDAMLKSATADELATQILRALDWYGCEDVEATDPTIRQHLVWAALMLELDPPDQQQAGHVAGHDLEGPHNWGLTSSERQALFIKALALRTYLPRLALHVLGPAVPDLMVEHVDEDLRYGSASWVNFANGVALANALQPQSSATLTVEQLIQLPLNLTQGADDEQLRLIAVTRALPCITWAVAHGVLQGNAGRGWSVADLNIATIALDKHLMQATKAVEDITDEPPERRKMAYEKLQELFGVNYAQFLQYRVLHGASIWKQLVLSSKNPSQQESGGKFFLIDLFAAGKMINGLDQFQPFASIHEQEEANQKFSFITDKIKGIDIFAMYETAFDLYETRAKVGYAFFIENLLSRLPVADRKALQNGQVLIHTLRTGTGKLSGWEQEQDRIRKRGRFGFIIECHYRDSTFFYEMFPLLGLFVRHDKLAIPTTRAADYPSALPSALEITTGTEVAIDWNAYETLAAPKAGQSAIVISERVLEFAAPQASDDNEPILLTSIRFKHIAFAVAVEHLLFNPHDSREHHRQRTPSEIVAATYPPILRALELIVPGLACANAIATDEMPEVICSLEAAPLSGSAFRVLRGTVRLVTSAGQLIKRTGLPTFATLMLSVLPSTAARYRQALFTVGMSNSAGALISRAVSAGNVSVKGINALAARIKRYVNTGTGKGAGYSLITSIPSVPASEAWRPLSAFDALGQVNGVKQVPVRSISDPLSRTGRSHYLLNPQTGMPFGPRLIHKKAFNLQRINNQVGYPMSGRGAMSSPIASPNSGTLGQAVDAAADLGVVLSANKISATQDQLDTIRLCLDEGIPVFVYETSSGSKSLALHVADEKVYRNVFTDTKVYFFRHYNHRSLRTWKVSSAGEEQIKQVTLNELLPGRTHLSPDRLANVREAIVEGQLLPPIMVRPPSHGLYSVIDGNHRLAVARELGLETVPVQIAPV